MDLMRVPCNLVLHAHHPHNRGVSTRLTSNLYLCLQPVTCPSALAPAPHPGKGGAVWPGWRHCLGESYPARARRVGHKYDLCTYQPHKSGGDAAHSTNETDLKFNVHVDRHGRDVLHGTGKQMRLGPFSWPVCQTTHSIWSTAFCSNASIIFYFFRVVVRLGVSFGSTWRQAGT